MRQPVVARPMRRHRFPTRCRCRILLALAAALLTRTAAAEEFVEDLVGRPAFDGGYEGPIAETEEEAARIAQAILEHVRRPSKVSGRIRAYSPLPLLPMLDSKNAAIRKIASEAFVELVAQRQEILLGECIPYLGSDRPIQERAPLLVLCALQIGGGGEYASVEGTGEKVKASLRQLTAECQVTPPHFEVLALVLAERNQIAWGRGVALRRPRRRGMAVTEAVAEEDRQLFGARLLAVLPVAMQTYERMMEDEGRLRVNVRRDIFDAVLALGEPYVGEVVESWYRTEPDPDLRAVVTDESLSWWLRPDWPERRWRVLELAAEDWNTDIADKARKLLERREPEGADAAGEESQ